MEYKEPKFSHLRGLCVKDVFCRDTEAKSCVFLYSSDEFSHLQHDDEWEDETKGKKSDVSSIWSCYI